MREAGAFGVPRQFAGVARYVRRAASETRPAEPPNERAPPTRIVRIYMRLPSCERCRAVAVDAIPASHHHAR